MTIRLGMLMDPIDRIRVAKDSSFAMLLEAQRRGWELWYLELADLWLRDGEVWAHLRRVEVTDSPDNWHCVLDRTDARLAELDLLLMRKDPPVNSQYLHATQLLEIAERAGLLIVNRPQALRDANEKLAATWFPELCPATLVSAAAEDLRAFLDEQQTVVLKPLDSMGGTSIFKLVRGDPNTNVILETMTAGGSRYVMAQRFIPEITAGDKRVLVVDGEVVPYALARIPQGGEFRGNLAAGGLGVGIRLGEADRHIAATVAPTLRERGVWFAGLDVIGDRLTEINITSPTCIRELDAQFSLNIAGMLFDALEPRLP
jgi:glutathione synthase